MKFKYLIYILSALSTFSTFASKADSLSDPFTPFNLTLPHQPDRPRNTFWPAFGSLLLPGLDQWWEGQNQAGLVYSGGAYLGLQVASHAFSKGDTIDIDDIGDRDNRTRQYSLGLQIYQTMGGFSAYHSFRSAALTHKSQGEYLFLPEEDAGDVMLAPFQFSYLTRPSTYWILAGLAAWMLYESRDNNLNKYNDGYGGYTGNDFFYAGAFSYNAGTHEEAVFRGWLMPYLYNSWGNKFWSNTTTALFFASAHISSANPLPLPQFALGWYLGYLTQQNQWSIKESVFLHAWWDVLVFNFSYFADSTSSKTERVFRFPNLYFTF